MHNQEELTAELQAQEAQQTLLLEAEVHNEHHVHTAECGHLEAAAYFDGPDATDSMAYEPVIGRHDRNHEADHEHPHEHHDHGSHEHHVHTPGCGHLSDYHEAAHYLDHVHDEHCGHLPDYHAAEDYVSREVAVVESEIELRRSQAVVEEAQQRMAESMPVPVPQEKKPAPARRKLEQPVIPRPKAKPAAGEELNRATFVEQAPKVAPETITETENMTLDTPVTETVTIQPAEVDTFVGTPPSSFAVVEDSKPENPSFSSVTGDIGEPKMPQVEAIIKDAFMPAEMSKSEVDIVAGEASHLPLALTDSLPLEEAVELELPLTSIHGVVEEEPAAIETSERVHKELPLPSSEGNVLLETALDVIVEQLEPMLTADIARISTNELSRLPVEDELIKRLITLQEAGTDSPIATVKALAELLHMLGFENPERTLQAYARQYGDSFYGELLQRLFELLRISGRYEAARFSVILPKMFSTKTDNPKRLGQLVVGLLGWGMAR